MLAKELEKSINEINETKKMMLETNNEILAVNIQLKENDLALIEADLASEQDEEKIAELEARKAELLQEIEDMKVEAEKENQELEEIGKDLAVVKESKYSHVYDLLDDIDKEIQKYSIKISTEGATSLTDEDKNKMDKYMAMKRMVLDAINLTKLDNDTSFNLSKKFLKENYSKLSKEIQTKLSKDKKYIFPSCFQLKASINKIVRIKHPEYDEKKATSLSKAYTSFILNHMRKIDLKEEGVYVYYLMKNIYEIDNLPIDKHFEYVDRLMNILERL